MRAGLLLVVAAALVNAPAQGENLFERLRTSTDVGWLESLAGSADAARQITPAHFTWKSTKEAAYIRLGAIGSPDAISAARRVEAAARAWSLVPPTVSLDTEIHAASHFSDSAPAPFAQVAGPGGLTYALFALHAMGGRDVFLATRTGPSANWTRPLLLPNRADNGMDDPRLTRVDGDRLRLDFQIPADSRRGVFPFYRQPSAPVGATQQEWTISRAAVRRDTDGDGWTDIEEARLGLRSDNPDSDGDGVPDGQDVCPNSAPSSSERADPEAAILQKVFFAAYGIHESPYVLLVKDGSRALQLWGSRGPVLFGVDRADWIRRFGGGPPELSWKLTQFDAAAGTATVTFSDFEGAMAAASYTTTLRRIDGEWFVTSIVMTSIS